MFVGDYRGRWVIFREPKDAATLRNKGYVGKNIGQKLVLDIYSSLFLAWKGKAQIRKGATILSPVELNSMISEYGREIFYAYKFLREKGFKPLWNRNYLWIFNERVEVVKYESYLLRKDFRNRQGYLVVVDREGECILYRIERFVFPEGHVKFSKSEKLKENDNINYFFSKKLAVKSGSKYGSDYRIYDGSVPHAKYLLSISEKIDVKDLIARVRIANSVRKLYIQGYREKRFIFYSVKWINV